MFEEKLKCFFFKVDDDISVTIQTKSSDLGKIKLHFSLLKFNPHIFVNIFIFD